MLFFLNQITVELSGRGARRNLDFCNERATRYGLL